MPWWVIDARRIFSGVCSRWRLIVISLHRFFTAISRAVVHHDGGAGASIDPMVWSAGGAPKRRRVAVRDQAFLPGPADLWVGTWVGVVATPISCRDIEVWPYSVGMLVKWVAFLGTLHWPEVECNLGVGGVSYAELLILYELWAGERLKLEKAVPRIVDLVAQFQCRLFLLVQALIFGGPASLLVLCFGVFGTCLLVFELEQSDVVMSTDSVQALLLAVAQQSMSIASVGFNLFSDRTYTLASATGTGADMLGTTLCP